MSLTRQLREELARQPVGPYPDRLVEAAAMVRFGGTLRLRGGGGGLVVEVRCAQGVVARRLRATLVEVLDVRPGLARRRGGNLTGSDAYLVEVHPPALHPLGILDGQGRPVEGVGTVPQQQHGCYLAGALMVAGSLSGRGRPVHLEISAPGERTATDIAALMGAHASGTRVVVKDGDEVERLLHAAGASDTAATFASGRRSRALRRAVNRSVNADRANLRRTADAASTQIQQIQRIVEAVGWDGLPDDVREVALVRLANPEASLADLGRLLDPPVGKATVHRRLARLQSGAPSSTPPVTEI